MKAFWLGCTVLAGSAMLILTFIHVRHPKTTGDGSNHPLPNVGRLSSRGHVRTVSHDLVTDAAFENMPAGEKRETALRLLADRRAAGDPADAEHWAESIKLESEREVALNHIAVAWGKTAPLKAIELSQRHHLSSGIVETITEQWGRTDPHAAMKWALGLSSPEEQENALPQVLSAHAENDPAGAALLVSERLPPGPAQDEAVMTVLYHWLRSDEAAAVAWAEAFADGKLRLRAEAEIRGFRTYRAAASVDH